VTDINLILQNFGYHGVVPCVWSCYIYIGQKDAGLAVVIITRREYLLFVKLFCNLSRAFTSDTEVEYPLDNRCSVLIGNNLAFGIVLILLVAIGRSGRNTFAPLRFR
jgi:hypothetical protein